MLSTPATGRCQCDSVHYRVLSPPYVSYTCHCKECQRVSSSAFNTCIQVASESVILTGERTATRVRIADSGNALTSWFCPLCGSMLYSQNAARPKIRTVYVGTLDQADAVDVNAHIWLKRKLPWVLIPTHHRQFDGNGDWSEDYADDLSRYKP